MLFHPLGVYTSIVNLVLTCYWKPYIGYRQVNWQFSMLCQLINSKLVSTACSLALTYTELQKCMH